MTIDIEERFLRLTEDQRVRLNQIVAIEMGKRLAVRFENPETDQENIRRAAYLDGGLDMLQYLLGFDQQLVQDAEVEKQQLLQEQSEGSSATDNLPAF